MPPKTRSRKHTDSNVGEGVITKKARKGKQVASREILIQSKGMMEREGKGKGGGGKQGVERQRVERQRVERQL